MMYNRQQATNADQWAAEWAELRRTALRNLKQQQLELRMQEAEPSVIAQVDEAWAFLGASLRSMETASKRHGSTVRARLGVVS